MCSVPINGPKGLGVLIFHYCLFHFVYFTLLPVIEAAAAVSCLYHPVPHVLEFCTFGNHGITAVAQQFVCTTSMRLLAFQIICVCYDTERQ